MNTARPISHVRRVTEIPASLRTDLEFGSTLGNRLALGVVDPKPKEPTEPPTAGAD